MNSKAAEQLTHWRFAFESFFSLRFESQKIEEEHENKVFLDHRWD
jgi:hypothetical protein